MRTMVFVIFTALFTTPLFAQRDATVPDPDPEVERKSFQVADGFEVNLFAADPLLAKPLQMNFDAAGRLWVATSETYPQIKPGAKANDKIIILEDTKGVGRADKTTVFMDGLLIPTGLEPGDGGVYVANSTELLHVTEKNGKADKVRVLLSGFGTEDTHHILHTLRWGPDGLLYMNQSIYIHSHIETPYGPRRLNAGGIWAFRPETMQLEVFARGWINSWGHHFDRWGQSFVTDGAGGEGINWVVPGGYYPAAIGPHSGRGLHGLNPGHPKYCGCEIVSGRHLPDDWQGNVLTNDFRGHRVCRFVLKEDGAGFAAVQMPDVIKSTHPAFRPIDVKMGPDGAIYIADWYNPIIQHGEVDFRDPRRDVTHGRIWRVTAKGRKLVERPKLVGAKVEELLEHLKAPEQWTRHFAKRVLKERGAKEVVPALEKWTSKLDKADRDVEHHLLEALWTYDSLAVPETERTMELIFKAKDARVRAATVRIASHWAESRCSFYGHLIAHSAQSEYPRVRLEAVRAMAKFEQDNMAVEAAIAALWALEKPMDQWLDYALWLTIRELESAWMPLLKGGEIPFAPEHLIFALQAVDARDAAQTIVRVLKSRELKKKEEEQLLKLLADIGAGNELRLVFDRALAKETSAATRRALLSGLEQVARQRQVKPAGDVGRVEELFAGNDDDVTAGARLAGLWKVESLRKPLFGLALGRAGELRRAAVEGLAAMGGSASRDLLVKLAGREHPAELRTAAIVALASLDLNLAASHATAALTAEARLEDVTAMVSALVQRKNGPEALAKALGNVKLPADVAKVALRTMRSSGRETQALTAALNKSGGLTEARHTLTAAEMGQMVEDVRKSGDAARGEAVYRRKDMACLKCHAIAGAGGLAGPDLISIGASAQIDYLIDSMLLPNKQVKENYNSLKVDLKDGRQITGVKVRENQKELVLRDGEDREVVIPQGKIDEKTVGGSIMPEGLVDSLTRGELIDLVRFLSELGKVGGPYAVSNARLVRRWEVLETKSETYTALYRVGIHAPASDPKLAWSPAYSTVAGLLPEDALPRFVLKRGLEKAETPFGFARWQLEVTTPGKVRLKLNGTAGLSVWLDGSAVDVKDVTDIDVKTGQRTLTVGVDWSQRKDGLRIEFDEAPGSAAQARIVGGK